MIKYISPSSFGLWNRDRLGWYRKYMSKIPEPREPQTRPMALGSGFDALIKSWLSERLTGVPLPLLWEQQVDEPWRIEVLSDAAAVLAAYIASGAPVRMMSELSLSATDVRFEYTVSDNVTLGGVSIPLLGKPDVYFTLSDGVPVIYDWKVNGWYGKQAQSPKPGYLGHRDSTPLFISGIECNAARTIDSIDEAWGIQTGIYGWVLGAPVGSKFIVGIDQIVTGGRVAQFRGLLNRDWQLELANRLKDMWIAISTGYIFTDLTREDSDALIASFDDNAAFFSLLH